MHSHMKDMLKHQRLANKGSELDKLLKTQRTFFKQLRNNNLIILHYVKYPGKYMSSQS